MSLPDEEHRQSQAWTWWKAWQQVKAGAPRSGKMADEERQELVVSELIKYCGPEIFDALCADAVGRVFCRLVVVVDYKRMLGTWGGDLSSVRAGVRRALHTELGPRSINVAAHVGTAVAAEIAIRRDERIALLRSQKVKKLLPDLLEAQSHNRRNAAVFLDHLTHRQRSNLKVLLHDQLNDKPAIYIRMDREPDNAHMWLYWYLYHSEFALPENKRKIGGIPRDLIAVRLGDVRTNKRGEVIMPLGPMFAKVFDRQKSEMNKLGLRPKNPGVNKIAESLGADHGSITRWLKEDQPMLNTWSDGKGGVYYDFTLATVNRNIEIVKGQKRGPKPKNT